MATVLPVRNETSHTTMRMTKEGRKISYRLTVIQQPERARACGSGAKCEWSPTLRHVDVDVDDDGASG